MPTTITDRALLKLIEEKGLQGLTHAEAAERFKILTDQDCEIAENTLNPLKANGTVYLRDINGIPHMFSQAIADQHRKKNTRVSRFKPAA